MHFQEAYKQLEKLCDEIMVAPKCGVTAYIKEMETTSGGRSVMGWDEDLKMLKHCRFVRNQISHEPGCTEENTCEPGDAAWAEQFRERIMTGDDPLARRRRMRQAEQARRAAQERERARRRAEERQRASAEGQGNAAEKGAAAARPTDSAPQKGPQRRRGRPAVVVPILAAVILLALIAFIARKAFG